MFRAISICLLFSLISCATRGPSSVNRGPAQATLQLVLQDKLVVSADKKSKKKHIFLLSDTPYATAKFNCSDVKRKNQSFLYVYPERRVFLGPKAAAKVYRFISKAECKKFAKSLGHLSKGAPLVVYLDAPEQKGNWGKVISFSY
jgi:hypothetical protein